MARKKQIDATLFQFADVHWEDPNTGKRAQKWKRVAVTEIPNFQSANSNYNVFATVQRFKNPVHTTPEQSYMPFYFDLDSDRDPLKLILMGRMAPEALNGKLSAPILAAIKNMVSVGIEMDDDELKNAKEACKHAGANIKEELWNANLEISQSDARKIVTFFREELGLPKEDIRVYFSGKKGFHILISPVALGVEPHTDLHLIYKFMALYLMQRLGLEALDYSSIYSSRRMLRLPNSIHQGSHLFKVELTHEELELPVTQIRDLARSPRDPLYADVNEQQSDVAAQWYEQMMSDWEDSETARNQKIVVKDETLAQMEDYPVCVQDILDNGIKKAGDRNKATMALASYFKDRGTAIAETERILTEWADRIPTEMTSAHGSSRKASTQTAVRTIYTDEKYHFACPFIRSLHGERKGRDADAVPCAGRACPLHDDHRIDMEASERMHLSDTAKAEYTGKKVAFDCLVSGKLDTPYIVPKKVNFFCTEADTCDKECALRDFGGFLEKEFGDNERILIEATNQNDNNLKGILRHYSGAAPGCKKVGLEVESYVNVEELLVVPMAERVYTVQRGDGAQVDMDESGHEYVARKVYFVGGKVASNQYYEFEGYVYPHPKTQFGTILSQKYTPKQDNVGAFQLTPEIIESFKIFQPQPGETVEDRLDILLEDLTENVTLVWQREEVLLGVLLTYHSALTFDFQGQRQKRGWLETIIIGDTGMAKTQLVQNFAEFAGLGEFASGESASRTGLIYRLDQIGERWFVTWGKYPLNDRKLLVIDELTGLKEDDLGRMTESRSTGVLKVDRAVNAETNARTRLLFMTNPRHGKQLFEFSHGIESLKSIFAEAADIRRLDLALFLATKDIPKDVLNRRFTRPEIQLVKADVMKHSILWVWSRKPEQIIITPLALDRILYYAGELGTKYGSAEDIPLVSPADERIKLARMAVALAGMMHSTDAAHELVIVQPEHVEYVVKNYLEIIYDAKNCRYDQYAANAKTEGELSEDDTKTVTEALQRLDDEDSLPLSKDILELFKRNDTLKSSDLQDMTGQDEKMVNPRLAVLAKLNFLKRTKNGFRKLPKFIEYLDQI